MDDLPSMDVAVPGLALQIFTAIGLVWAFYKLFSFLRLMTSLFLLPGTPLSTFGPKGSWAVITGASDGLGAEYARQLARKGFNVVLVSRTASKVETLSDELKKSYPGVQTATVPMDFSQNLDTDYASLQEIVRDLDVAILINNVGVSHSIPVPFTETPQSEIDAIITVNVVATLRVTQLLAPAMAMRRRGLILTMASFGGILPTPLLATYSGSKAFLQQWSSALGAELESEGVTVQLVQSYLVTSAMSKIRKTSMFIPSPKAFVSSTLARVGRSGGAQHVAYTSTPYWSHAVMQWALATFVGTMNTRVVKQNKSMHEGIRKRALRKQAQEAKKQ